MGREKMFPPDAALSMHVCGVCLFHRLFEENYMENFGSMYAFTSER